MNALCLHVLTLCALPVNAALDFTFEIGRVLAWLQGHLDVDMGVWLEFARHGFQLQSVTAKFKLKT
jgi:hypothetical protein